MYATLTAIKLHSHWYVTVPFYWFETYVARSDWWPKFVLNNCVAVYVTIELLTPMEYNGEQEN